MFLISNFALKQSKLVKDNNIQAYSVGLGIVIYASIYMYLLFRNSEYLAIFNKFVIYIVGVDLLLCAFLYSKSAKPSPSVAVESYNWEKSEDESSDTTEDTAHNSVYDDTPQQAHIVEAKLEEAEPEEAEPQEAELEEAVIQEAVVEQLDRTADLEDDNSDVATEIVQKLSECLDEQSVPKKRGRKPKALNVS